MRRTLAALLLLVVPTVLANMQPIAGVATTMEIVKAGSGPTVAARDTVTVHGTSPSAHDHTPRVRFSLEASRNPPYRSTGSSTSTIRRRTAS